MSERAITRWGETDPAGLADMRATSVGQACGIGRAAERWVRDEHGRRVHVTRLELGHPPTPPETAPRSAAFEAGATIGRGSLGG